MRIIDPTWRDPFTVVLRTPQYDVVVFHQDTAAQWDHRGRGAGGTT